MCLAETCLARGTPREGTRPTRMRQRLNVFRPGALTRRKRGTYGIGSNFLGFHDILRRLKVNQVMRFFSLKVFRVFAVLTSVVAALILGSHWVHPLGLIVLPLVFPGCFIFGDEWEPKLGVWGALLAGWIISMPVTYIAAYTICFLFSMGNDQSGNDDDALK